MGSILSKPKTPDLPPPPKPVAPTVKDDKNVQQSGEANRRKMASMSGRKQANILDPSSALKDKEKDILG